MSYTIDKLIKELDGPVNDVPKIYSKRILSNKTNSKVFEYQKKNILKIINSLLMYNVALDNSDTGTGKTFMAVATCIELGKRPIIVCPKTLMFTWIDVCKYFSVEPYDIVNYETIRTCKSYTDNTFSKRITSPFIEIVKIEGGSKYKYVWNIPDDGILIFDEAHRCKSHTTDNGKMLIGTKDLIKSHKPVLLLSASICEKYVDMRIIFFLFDFIQSLNRFQRYVKMLSYKYPNYKVHKRQYDDDKKYLVAKENSISMMINEEIKRHSARIRIKDLGDNFPSNQWFAQQFYADSADQISKAYEEIAVHIQAIKNKEIKHHLSAIQKLKQEIEIRKVPIFIEQAQMFLDDGKSVIIFVNYLETLRILSKNLNITCKIMGNQSALERKEEIEKFQSNQEKIIICQIRSGGVGISLHDIYGGHPRATLINYPDSASDLLQALGRAHRAGGKSPVLQRIIFVANVEYERTIMENINRKLSNISAINDGDLDGYKYDIKTK